MDGKGETAVKGEESLWADVYTSSLKNGNSEQAARLIADAARETYRRLASTTANGDDPPKQKSVQ